jgi:hypothetical protein
MLLRMISAVVLAASILSLVDCKSVELGPTDPDKDADRTPSSTDTATYACSGKTSCSAMTSCSEAIYYLQHCPFAAMDGDGDGIPCEDQWCGH